MGNKQSNEGSFGRGEFEFIYFEHPLSFNILDERLQYHYGPSRNVPTSHHQQDNRVYDSPLQPRKPAPPPPYSAVNPSPRQQPAPNLNQIPVAAPRRPLSHQSIPNPGLPAPPTQSAPRPFSIQNPPPIPPLPHKVNQKVNQIFTSRTQNFNRNLFKWQSAEVLNHNLSAAYSSKQDPYVWKKQDNVDNSRTITIDLNQELPMIQQTLKDNKLPSFQLFVKELGKKKELAECRKLMVNNKYLSNVKFHIGGSTIYGHKMFLITASFLFYEEFHLKGESEFTVDSVNMDTFMMLINYCYTGKLPVNEANVLDLLLGASKLQVRQATNICHGFISNLMSQDSIFVIFEKALDLQNEVFQKKCLDYIAKNEETCFSSKGFFEISLPSLMKILEVCKYSREKVDEVVNKWTSGGMGPMMDTKPLSNVAQPSKPQAKLTPKETQKGAVSKGKPVTKKNFPAKAKSDYKRCQSIPDLMSLSIANPLNGPPMIPPFPFPPPNMYPNPHLPSAYRPFAAPQSKNQPLINFDDDEDDRSSIISKDDEGTVKVFVQGKRFKHPTEVSRIDFVCKRSMLLQEVFFSQNLALGSKDIHLTVGVIENNKTTNIHSRHIVNKPGE